MPKSVSHSVMPWFAAAAALALSGAAQAVDLRDWGRKYAASERFVVLSQFNNEAVLDKETQLVWERQPIKLTGGLIDPRTDWATAKQKCATKVVGGRMGWRLPYFHELLSVVDPVVVNPPALPAGHPFDVALKPTGYYWTSTRSPEAAGGGFRTYVIALHSHGELIRSTTDNTALYWCVRGSGSTLEY